MHHSNAARNATRNILCNIQAMHSRALKKQDQTHRLSVAHNNDKENKENRQKKGKAV